jgi:hypothetical protein
MKKLILTSTTLVAFMLPMVAQGDTFSSLDERVAVVTALIPTDGVSSSIIQAVNTKFDKNNPLTWSSFPHQLKEYGWVYDIGSSSVPLTNFEVTMKTTAGDVMSAIYGVDGNLLETREISKNIPLPRYVMEALTTSEFKDWTVVGNREVTRFYQDPGSPRADQIIKLTLEKESSKKKLTFKYVELTGKYQVFVRR